MTNRNSSSTNDPLEIHAQFIQIAEPLSPALVTAIQRNGPQKLTPNRDQPFAVMLCRAIAGQQLSVKATATIWQRVLDSSEGENLIEHISRADTEILRACGLSGSKTKAVKCIAEAHYDGKLDPAILEPMDHYQRSKQLTSIWGVGQWTADMMGISYFADPNIWPEGDVTVMKWLTRLTSKRRKTLRTAERFAPYRTYLALHMWETADAPPMDD